MPRQYDYWACYKNIHKSIICKCQQIRNDSNIHHSRMDDKLWYILILETIQQRNIWTIASLKNMAKFPRQNDELKTSNTSICGMCVCVQLIVSNSLWTPWTVSCQVPLSMEYSRQEYASGLPFPPPGDLPWSRNWTCAPCVFCFGKPILYHFATWEAPCVGAYSVTSSSLWPQGL